MTERQVLDLLERVLHAVELDPYANSTGIVGEAHDKLGDAIYRVRRELEVEEHERRKREKHAMNYGYDS